MIAYAGYMPQRYAAAAMLDAAGDAPLIALPRSPPLMMMAYADASRHAAAAVIRLFAPRLPRAFTLSDCHRCTRAGINRGHRMRTVAWYTQEYVAFVALPRYVYDYAAIISLMPRLAWRTRRLICRRRC